MFIYAIACPVVLDMLSVWQIILKNCWVRFGNFLFPVIVEVPAISALSIIEINMFTVCLTDLQHWDSLNGGLQESWQNH